MAKDPAFLFYPNDWIGGTMGMTFEEKGAYIEVLMMQFNRGHMSGHMIGQVIGQLWDKIKDKFTQDEKGLWYNVRLENEQKLRKAFTESRRNNINGTNQYTKKQGHMTSHMENENENENINENIIKEEVKKFNFKSELLKLSNDENLVKDWLKVREKKKSSNTETAFKGFLREVNKSGKCIDEILQICVEKDWKAFNSEWILKEFKSQEKSKNEKASDRFLEIAQRNIEIYEQMKLNNEI
jgi:uncharacterized protein YdaU (DUF1376 family)